MLQAQIDGKWGPIPDSILDKVKMPEIGTVTAFEFLYSFKDSMNGKRRFKAHQGIRSIVPIRDGKKSIQIGLIGGVDQNGNPLPYDVRRVDLRPQAGNGIHFITIGNSGAGDELYQYLMLTSENEASPVRDEGIEAVIRTKDFVADAKKNLEAKASRREAQGIAIALKGEELKETAALLGFNPKAEPATLLDQVEDEALANPDKFLALMKDEDRAAKTVLAMGLANGALRIDPSKNALMYAEGGNQILGLTNLERDAVIEQFAEMIRTDANGKKTLAALKSYVEAKEKLAKK